MHVPPVPSKDGGQTSKETRWGRNNRGSAAAAAGTGPQRPRAADLAGPEGMVLLQRWVEL